MKNPPTGFQHAGSFIAGLLIGLSIMVPMFAMLVTNPGDWQMVWVFGALAILVLGFKLQVITTTIKSRDRRRIGASVETLPSHSWA